MLKMNDYKLLYLMSNCCDDEAKEVLIEKYKLLLYKHVNKIFSKYTPQGVERDDMFQEGQIALFNSLYTYDECMSVPFYSFTSLCIERSMIAYLRRFSSMASLQFYNSLSLDSLVSEELSLYYSDVISDNSEPSSLVLYNESLGELYLYNTVINDFEKKVLVLQISGYTYKESSSILKCSVKKIDNTIQKVKRLLN